MYEINIQLPFNGYHVKGILSLPVQAKSIIIFSHGLSSSRQSSHELRIAAILQKNGFGTLQFDLMDQREELPSDFKNIDQLSKGIVTTADWLHGHSEYRSLRQAILGSGSGSATAIKAAVELGSGIKALVSLSGRLDLVKRALSEIVCPTLLIAGELDFQNLNYNRKAIHEIKATKQLAVISGASHLFAEAGKTKEAANIALSWFTKYLPQPQKNQLD